MHQVTAIISHPDQPLILVSQNGDGWGLPCISDSENSVPEINREILERFSLPVTMRRYLSRRKVDDEHGDVYHWVYTFDSHELLDHVDPGGRWVGLEQATALASADQRPFVEEAFAEMSGERIAPPLRNSWTRPGWFREAVEWADTVLKLRGIGRKGPAVQTQAWSISSMFRADTSEGPVYFKAVPPIFAAEPRVFSALADRHPDHLPEVLGWNETCRWFVTRGLDAKALFRKKDPSVWEEAVRRFAQIQIDWIGREETLLDWGLPDRRLSGLPEEIDRVWEDLEIPERRALFAISEEDAARLRPLASRLKGLAGELAAIGVPETLIHGDLHGGNTMVGNGRTYFIDWSDAAVAHPFFDLETLLPDPEEEPETFARLRDAYLQRWTELLSLDKLLEAFELSRRLAPVYHAYSYHDLTLNLEPLVQWEMADGLPEFLVRALPRLDGVA